MSIHQILIGAGIAIILGTITVADKVDDYVFDSPAVVNRREGIRDIQEAEDVVRRRRLKLYAVGIIIGLIIIGLGIMSSPYGVEVIDQFLNHSSQD